MNSELAGRVKFYIKKTIRARLAYAEHRANFERHV